MICWTLDQLTARSVMGSGAVKIWIAVADVDVLVKKNSAIDAHARINTTSVWDTSARVFPMLPERLSTNLTSLNLGGARGHRDRNGGGCRGVKSPIPLCTVHCATRQAGLRCRGRLADR